MPSPHGARGVGDAEREGDGGGSARDDSKEPLGPHGDARPRPGTGPGSGGAPAGGGRGIPGTAGERLSNGRGRLLGAAGSAGTRGSPHCLSLGIPPAPLRLQSLVLGV